MQIFLRMGPSLARTALRGNRLRCLGSARWQSEHRAAGKAGDRFQLRGQLPLREVAPVFALRLPVESRRSRSPPDSSLPVGLAPPPAADTLGNRGLAPPGI